MRKRKKSFFDVVVYAISTLLAIIVLYPLILVLSNSVSDPSLVAAGKVLFLPKGINFEGYKEIARNKDLVTGYANTIFYTVFGTIINLLVTVPAGYVLTKKTLPGNGFIMGMFMFTMYFGGGMIPLFLLINNMGLYNTRTVLLILGAFSTYNCIICRSFFNALPKELEEAAEIDGSCPIKTFITIVIPLSKALLGVMTLYFGVGHWNAYFDAMIYTKDKSLQPLQLFLRRILILAQSVANGEVDGEFAAYAMEKEILLRYSVIVASALPLLIIYPFLQKYFDKGVLIGSVKG